MLQTGMQGSVVRDRSGSLDRYEGSTLILSDSPLVDWASGLRDREVVVKQESIGRRCNTSRERCTPSVNTFADMVRNIKSCSIRLKSWMTGGGVGRRGRKAFKTNKANASAFQLIC
jgi:hypothetical protein